MGIRLTLFVIDLPLFQYLPYLFFGDVAAIHPAFGMTGEDKMIGMAVDWVRARLPCLPAPGQQHNKDRYYSEFHRILTFLRCKGQQR